MFEGFTENVEYRRVPWEELQPGMIVLGGVSINGALPFELIRHPVLTHSLIAELHHKYRFLQGKAVLVTSDSGPQGTMSDFIAEEQRRFGAFQYIRSEYYQEKTALMRNLLENSMEDSSLLNDRILEALAAKSLVETPVVAADTLILDSFSSFQVPFDSLPEDYLLPSLFGRPDLQLTIEELLNGRLFESLKLPADEKITLHLMVDYSFSMERNGKLKVAMDTANYLYKKLPQILPGTEVRLYAFSSATTRVTFPLTGREIDREDTYFARFMKAVLRESDRGPFDHADRHAVMVFTDGEPTDVTEALRAAERLKTRGIDYTHIVFDFNDQISEIALERKDGVRVTDGYVDASDLPDSQAVRELTPAELEERRRSMYEVFTALATAAGGNQIVLKVYEFLKLLSVEVYDRYLGMLTVSEDR